MIKEIDYYPTKAWEQNGKGYNIPSKLNLPRQSTAQSRRQRPGASLHWRILQALPFS